jgi:hypothetical protein
MRVQLLMLEALIDAVGRTDKERFLEEHQGVFLVAMGVLSAEVVRSATRANKTVALAMGRDRKHDLKSKHPLAGCAFLLQARDQSPTVDLGRAVECDIAVPDESVSERHCRLELTDEGLLAVDLNPTNFTQVNLRALAPGQAVLLADEDILTLGRYSFQVMSATTLYAALALLRAIRAEDEDGPR